MRLLASVFALTFAMPAAAQTFDELRPRLEPLLGPPGIYEVLEGIGVKTLLAGRWAPLNWPLFEQGGDVDVCSNTVITITDDFAVTMANRRSEAPGRLAHVRGRLFVLEFELGPFLAYFGLDRLAPDHPTVIDMRSRAVDILALVPLDPDTILGVSTARPGEERLWVRCPA